MHFALHPYWAFRSSPGGFPRGSVVKKIHLPIQETQVQSLGWEDSPEKEMATQSRILAWEITWTEETGGLQSTKRVGAKSKMQLLGVAKEKTQLSD